MLHIDAPFESVSTGEVTIHADTPTELASIPDRLAASLADPHDSLAGHGRHYDEQALTPLAAYREEMQLMPNSSWATVIEVPRPHRPNVIYLDRLHFVFGNAPPVIGGRLFGLYAGSRGAFTLFAHPPAGAAGITNMLSELETGIVPNWRAVANASFPRYVMHYDPEQGQLSAVVRVPPIAISQLSAVLSS